MPDFCGAFDDAQTLPPNPFLEVAFIGRSNVGKSSLLNSIFNTKKLARVSQTPGCTKALMLFKVTERFYVMDLPGYGFNRQPKHVQKKWIKALNYYLAYRKSLSQVYVLFDSRRAGISQLDMDMIAYLNHYHVPHTCVLTKVDKSNSKEKNATIQQLKKFLDTKSTNAQIIETSSVSKVGVDAIQESIMEYAHRFLTEI